MLEKITDKLNFKKGAVVNTSPSNFVKFTTSGQIEEVFTSGGVKYYRFIDEMRIPAKRAFAAKDVYEEFEYKTTKEHLEAYYTAVLDLCNEGKLTHIAALTMEMQTRLTYITHTDLLYKLASILYFDENENPEDYDLAYCFKKIELWQANNDLESFFYKTPLIEYLPFSNLSNINLEAYTKALRSEEAKQLMSLSRILSRSNENKELNTFLESQTTKLRSLISSMH